MENYIIIYSTTKNKQEAKDLAEHLLRRKLIACANIIDNVLSLYWWQKKIEEEKECLLILKTKASLYNAVEKFIKEHHKYDIPEIISVDIQRGDEDYLYWIKKNVEDLM